MSPVLLTLSWCSVSVSSVSSEASTLRSLADKDSSRLTTLSRSPMNMRNLSTSLGLHMPTTIFSTWGGHVGEPVSTYCTCRWSVSRAKNIDIWSNELIFSTVSKVIKRKESALNVVTCTNISFSEWVLLLLQAMQGRITADIISKSFFPYCHLK